MRARYPDVEDVVVRDGVRVGFEVYEPRDEPTTDATILLVTPMPLVHARQWKLQIPMLARHARVLVVDHRGNGRSDRPTEPAGYAIEEDVADVVAILDTTATARVIAVGVSGGGRRALELAAHCPERVAGVVAIAPTVVFAVDDFEAVREHYEGIQRFNRHHIRDDFDDFVSWFFAQCFTDDHALHPFEDAWAYAHETTPEVLVSFFGAASLPDVEGARALCRAVRCPVLVLHGTDDALIPHEVGEAVAGWTAGSLVSLEGVGHVPTVREPVRTNLLIRDFVRETAGRRSPTPRWTPPRKRARRALFLSSPIGLGHARRDLAIADELRGLRPDVGIEWLAQHPVSQVLAARGERIHPASRWLASEAGHVEGESGEHDLHAFRAWRSMDEILVHNFHVLAELAESDHHDLWVGDEAWELDHFLHENPELKSAAYAWLTDFVGFLPIDGDDAWEQRIAADHNAWMIEQVDRLPRVRDGALFVGDVEDVVPDAFGPGLPSIRAWTREHYAFPGYVTGFTPLDPADRAGVREELGWRPGEPVCLVTAGGTGIGLPLLRRVVDAVPAIRERVPEMRVVVVTGPRLDPDTVPPAPGLEVHGWVPDLHRHLGACDVAITHGGLTTTMELTAHRRPFLYVPLQRHFEQQRHVTHRLARHRAGRRMDWGDLRPDALADALHTEVARAVDYRPVDAGGAARAATRLASLL
ncbi:alpha/beta hydrolase [Actinomycetospora cinnamomea]|uniref:Pimeloyl-ACP methyl ester carboxylesterase n=1 Tax=Actinomycetospora cinnamomea TaxID=663609 RepID=A0A2U1F9K4_9PSEU|nr:alpha/beta fold hydrolase [Actinomycetospora cinnamomea]PVZ08862.1 pimeloyl-ACP methyl ester carboxylesterase [Actinomycetospora cinnamomea]